MARYLAQRLLLSVGLLFAVVLATFALYHALPGDPAAAVLGKQYSKEQAERIERDMGLDQPMHVQFGRYLQRLSRGDLGRSHVANRPVREQLASMLPATIELALAAMLLATVFGVTLGVLTSLRPRSAWDALGLGAALAGVSVPIFWLALLAIQVFGRNGVLEGLTGLPGLPLGGRFSPDVLKLDTFVATTPAATGFFLWDTLVVARDPGAFLHVLKHLVLPALVLASVPTAVITRITRAAMGEVLLQDYVRTARAKGLSPARVVLKHALRNAAIPIVTSIGTMLGYLLGGAVLTETVFQWPGMGRYLVEAILNKDVQPLQAGVLVAAGGFLVINLLVDLSYAWLDPRVRLSGGRP